MLGGGRNSDQFPIKLSSTCGISERLIYFASHSPFTIGCFLTPQVMDSSAYEAALDPSLHPLEVFETVESHMQALGCSGYKPSQVGRAATGQRGGAPALLLVSLHLFS